MTSVAILGATGNLGSHVARHALDRGWDLSVAVRSRSRLSQEVADRARVSIFDLNSVPADELARFLRGHDAFVCCAGVVTEAEGVGAGRHARQEEPVGGQAEK